MLTYERPFDTYHGSNCGAFWPALRIRERKIEGRGAGVESVRHFCQLAKNCAFASPMLAARPLVVMPSMGLTYNVIDQNHRSSGLLCRSSYSRPTSRPSSVMM